MYFPKKIESKTFRIWNKKQRELDVHNFKLEFEKEVNPYYSDAWMDRSKDKIGYEINFTQYFYKYVLPRPLEDIEKDIKKVTAEIQELIKEEV